MVDQGSAGQPGAAAALALIRTGEIERGLAQYEACLRGDNLPGVHVGLHAGMLEQAGCAVAATRLRQLGVRHGADLAVRAGSFLGADPEAAAQEYEQLFADGWVNSRMIYEYAKTLAQLGRNREHAGILAPETLFRTNMIDSPAPAGFGGTLATAVDELLLELEEEAEQQEAVQSVRNMRVLASMTKRDHPVARALVSEFERHTDAYLEHWRQSDHPFAAAVPRRFELRVWGLISRGDGFNVPHIHGEGWASGVFYPRSVDTAGGEFVVGKPKNASGTPAQWGERRVKPAAGLLILMPSFYTHWTVPLGQPGLRTSVAFDVVAAPDGAVGA